MKIEHVALWTHDLEASKTFFVEFFGGKAGEKYINLENDFHSYFLSFEDGARLEIMQIPSRSSMAPLDEQYWGFSHVAFSVGSEKAVDELTEKARQRNFKVIREPSFTGDGYYESCIQDADNNMIEITV